MDIPKKFCHECGKQIVFGAKFCPECGTSQASIDAKPPQAAQAATTPSRPLGVRPRRPATFTPIASDNDEYDDEGISADGVQSLSDLGISVAGLDVDFGRDFGMGRETVGALVSQGQQLPQGYKDPNARSINTQIDTKAVLAQVLSEGKALRPS